MKQALRTLLFLGLAATTWAQTPLSITLSANSALTGANSFAFSGTANITGLGSATLSGGGQIDNSLLSGQVTGAIPGTFTLIFSDGAVMFGTFSIPSGIFIPQIGGTTTATGSFTIAGGTGRFQGARGLFSSVTGTGTVTGATSASFTISGTGSVNAGQFVLPQFVFEGGWYTALYFANSLATPATFQVNFFADNGSPLNVPALSATSTTVTIPGGGSVRIEAPNTGAQVPGYASVTLPDGVTGYGVFRQSVTGVQDQEATVPLANAGSTSSSLTFDDTNYTTAVAIVNPSSVATTVTVTVKSANGGALGTATVALAAKSKTAVALRSLTGLSGIANNRGTATFTVTTGNVAVLGLRFFGTAFTSIPATDK